MFGPNLMFEPSPHFLNCVELRRVRRQDEHIEPLISESFLHLLRHVRGCCVVQDVAGPELTLVWKKVLVEMSSRKPQ